MDRRNNRQHGVYKFVTIDTNEIIYIGKTNRDFVNRVTSHIRGKGADEKFNKYMGNYKVYVAFMPNATETDIMERVLINKYKTVLNITDKYEGISDLIKIEEPEWVEYDKVFPKTSESKKTNKQKKKNPDNLFLIGHEKGINYYLVNRSIKKQDRRDINCYSVEYGKAIEYINNIVFLCKTYGYKDKGAYILSGRYIKYFKALCDEKNDGELPNIIYQEYTLSRGKGSMVIIDGEGYNGRGICKIYFYAEAIDILERLIKNKSISENEPPGRG